jgi:hypothetical protein
VKCIKLVGASLVKKIVVFRYFNSLAYFEISRTIAIKQTITVIFS